MKKSELKQLIREVVEEVYSQPYELKEEAGLPNVDPTTLAAMLAAVEKNPAWRKVVQGGEGGSEQMNEIFGGAKSLLITLALALAAAGITPAKAAQANPSEEFKSSITKQMDQIEEGLKQMNAEHDAAQAKFDALLKTDKYEALDFALNSNKKMSAKYGLLAPQINAMAALKPAAK